MAANGGARIENHGRLRRPSGLRLTRAEGSRRRIDGIRLWCRVTDVSPGAAPSCRWRSPRPRRTPRGGRRPSSGRTPRGRCPGRRCRRLPRYITAIRSASAETSSSSVDPMSTAVSRSRSARSAHAGTRWRRRLRRGSVGWRSAATRGRESSPASPTFCWFPPERDAAAFDRLGADVELPAPIISSSQDPGQVKAIPGHWEASATG